VNLREGEVHGGSAEEKGVALVGLFGFTVELVSTGHYGLVRVELGKFTENRFDTEESAELIGEGENVFLPAVEASADVVCGETLEVLAREA
jgi:hypothetical protein